MRGVDHYYNALHTLKAEFTELYTSGLTTQSESGTMYLEKPGRMRWDYRDPDHLFLIDGHNVWTYVPGDGVAQRTAVKDSADLRTPLRFLLGHTDLAQELTDTGYGELDPLEPGDLVLHGRPVQLAGLYREIWLEVAPDFSIRRIVFASVEGGTTDIRLHDAQANIKLPAGLFHFQPPPGVQVVEGSGG